LVVWGGKRLTCSNFWEEEKEISWGEKNLGTTKSLLGELTHQPREGDNREEGGEGKRGKSLPAYENKHISQNGGKGKKKHHDHPLKRP